MAVHQGTDHVVQDRQKEACLFGIAHFENLPWRGLLWDVGQLGLLIVSKFESPSLLN